jgi:hypothetical protein
MDCWPRSLPRSKKSIFSSLSIKFFLAIRNDRHGRGENMKKFAMGNVDNPDEAWHDVEVPQEVGVDLNIS